SERAGNGPASNSAGVSLIRVPIVPDKTNARAVPLGDFQVVFQVFARAGSADCRINLQASGKPARAFRRRVNTQGAAVAVGDKNVVPARCQRALEIFLIPASDMILERRRPWLVTRVCAA